MGFEMYELRWQEENRVFFVKFKGDLTLDELSECSKQILTEYVSMGHAPVHMICDIGEATAFPKNVPVLARETIAYLRHPNMGWITFVGVENQMAKFIVSVLTQMVSVNSKNVKTIDEAMEVLRRADLSLLKIS